MVTNFVREHVVRSVSKTERLMLREIDRKVQKGKEPGYSLESWIKTLAKYRVAM